VLLGALAFGLFGDVRWVNLVGVGLTAFMVRRMGRGPLVELALLLLLFQPGTFLVLVFAWTEPTLLLLWVAFLLGLLHWRVRPPRGAVAAGALGALFLLSKQYAFLLGLPFVSAVPRTGLRRACFVGIAVGCAVIIPFLAWNPEEFVKDVFAAQFLQPFRMDGTSWVAALARATGVRLPGTIGLGLGVLLATLAAFRSRSLAQAAAGAVVAFLALLLFHKQALLNYFWVLSGLLAVTVGLLHRTEAGHASVPPDPG